MENRKNVVSLDTKKLGSVFFVEILQKLRKRLGKMPNREAQRLPKGGQGRQKGEKNHWLFVESTNFWGLGASLSILDTKKTKKTKLVEN